MWELARILWNPACPRVGAGAGAGTALKHQNPVCGCRNPGKNGPTSLLGGHEEDDEESTLPDIVSWTADNEEFRCVVKVLYKVRSSFLTSLLGH
jgi:hypothetical protein